MFFLAPPVIRLLLFLSKLFLAGLLLPLPICVQLLVEKTDPQEFDGLPGLRWGESNPYGWCASRFKFWVSVYSLVCFPEPRGMESKPCW